MFRVLLFVSVVPIVGCHIMAGFDDITPTGGTGASDSVTSVGGTGGTGAGDSVTSVGGSGGTGGAGGTGPCIGALRVFVTSTTHTGDLKTEGAGTDGLTGADTICTNLARTSSLGGNWRAWLSTPVVDAKSRIEGRGPWCRTDGELVFSNQSAIEMAELDRPIDRTEMGMAPGTPTLVWTATDPSGTYTDGHCDSWTDDSLGNTGWVGNPNSADDEWTAQENVVCGGNPGKGRLYCFEQ